MVKSTNLRICDQINSGITTLFVTGHLLTLQNSLQVLSVAVPGRVVGSLTTF